MKLRLTTPLLVTLALLLAAALCAGLFTGCHGRRVEVNAPVQEKPVSEIYAIPEGFDTARN